MCNLIRLEKPVPHDLRVIQSPEARGRTVATTLFPATLYSLDPSNTYVYGMSENWLYSLPGQRGRVAFPSSVFSAFSNIATRAAYLVELFHIANCPTERLYLRQAKLRARENPAQASETRPRTSRQTEILSPPRRFCLSPTLQDTTSFV